MTSTCRRNSSASWPSLRPTRTWVSCTARRRIGGAGAADRTTLGATTIGVSASSRTASFDRRTSSAPSWIDERTRRRRAASSSAARPIEAVGGFEPRFHDLYEDQAFFFKLLLGHAAFVESQAWDRYRRHPAAMCEVRIRAGEHADDDTPTVARGAFLAWLEDYFTTTGVNDPGLWRLLRRERWPFRHRHRYRFGRQMQGLARAFLPASIRRAGRRVVGPRI